MKKILSLFFVILLVFSGCQMEPKEEAKNPNQDTLLYSGTIEGGQWEIRYEKEVKDGITSEVVNYILTENATGKRVGLPSINRAHQNLIAFTSSQLWQQGKPRLFHLCFGIDMLLI